jgi:hypothetical protein
MSPILLAIGSRLIPIVLVPGTVWPDEIFQKSATFAIVIAFGDRGNGVTFASAPLAPFVVTTFLGLILHRVIGERT